MRRIVIMVAMMAVMVAAMAVPAFANQYGKNNPYASVTQGSQGSQGACVYTYDGPNSPPGKAAKGGNPGYDYKQQVGHGC